MVSAVSWLSCLVSCLFSCVGLGWHVVLCLVLCLVLSWSWLSLEIGMDACILSCVGLGCHWNGCWHLVLCSCSKCQVEVADVSVSNGVGGVTIKNSLSFD